MNTLTTELYRVIDGGANVELAPAVPEHNGIKYENAPIEVFHKLGYWPLEQWERPQEEEGYTILDDGYKYAELENGDKYVYRHIRKLQNADNPPELADNQVIENDHWEEQGDKYVHVYPVWTVIDGGMPEVDESTHHYNGDEWVYDNENMTKTHVYHVLERVDNPPELSDGMEIVSDRWEVVDDKYVHRYEVRIIVDHPPVLEEGQQVLDFHWEDDGTYKTKVYDRIRFVVDNPPVLEEGQQIINRYEESDDGETVTFAYEVRFIVDNPPTLEEGQEIVDEHWDDDGTTKTHVYEVRFIVDNPPELQENQYIYEDRWEDDGTTRTHVYVVITRVDNPPEVGENQELEDLGWDLDLDAGTNTHNYRVWNIVDNPPELAEDEEAEDHWESDEENLTKTHVYKVWKIIDEGPKPPSGYLYEGGAPERVKDEAAGTITLVYPYVPYPVIRVSKLALEYTLGTLGKLDVFETFLGSLPDIDFGNGETKPVKHFYDTANELNTNNQLCVPYIEAAASALGMSINQVFDILQRCAVQHQQV